MKNSSSSSIQGGGVNLVDVYNRTVKKTDVCGTISAQTTYTQCGFYLIIEEDDMEDIQTDVIGMLNDEKYSKMHEQSRRVYGVDGVSPTIHTQGGGNQEPKIQETRYNTGLRIRKLTPKECWRLMGFDDEDFENASKVNSNSQLYKQAGNSIVVNVLEQIFKQML